RRFAFASQPPAGAPGAEVNPMPTASELIANLERLGDEFVAAIAPLGDEQAIRAAQAGYLGKKGKLSEAMKELGRLPAGDRPAVGAAAHQGKPANQDPRAARAAGAAPAPGS